MRVAGQNPAQGTTLFNNYEQKLSSKTQRLQNLLDKAAYRSDNYIFVEDYK